MQIDESINLLSKVVVYNKYAKYIPQEQRRETWDEIITRYLTMMVGKYPHLSDDIMRNGQYLYDKRVLPSMRALQFAGPAMLKNEARGYNCSYMPVDDYRCFSELMFLLLGGTGVGYSVQYHHVDKLPEIQKPRKEAKFLIGDSIEGWADAVKQLMKSYFGITKVKPRFDYSDIREKGAALITAGGKAPGPEPLKIALTRIEALLNEKRNGSKLTPFEVHRINCLIADAVLAGGIRRAALIALFSFDDREMATCKHGAWWELYPELGRANNSVVILRNRVKEEEFKDLWKLIVDSNSGEPGVYFTNDPEYGTNPCCEISLRPYTFCNLTEINAGTVKNQADFEDRIRVAAFFGTLQAGFTDFHYLRSIWKKNTEKDALIGVGITGIANGNLTNLNLTSGTNIALAENERVAELIGINTAARVTTVKPSGTTSCVVGTSSGIHAWHSKRYIRNIQCAVGDDLYNFFKEHHPLLIKVMDHQPKSAVIGIPQLAPVTATLREMESVFDLLERVKKFNLEWVKTGHRRGPNTNNVSATVYPKPEDWTAVGQWMWDNRDTYNGLSVLPYDGGSYRDTPFQEVSDKEFEEKLAYIQNNHVDLTLIKEIVDNTDLSAEAACAGGACETTF